MTYVSKFRATLNTALAARRDFAVQLTARRSSGSLTAAIVAKLRELAPYAMIELILPGGSVIALLLWLSRRRKKLRVVLVTEAIGRASVCFP